MDRFFINTILLASCLFISFSCAENKSTNKERVVTTESTTLYEENFLKGKISAITNSDKYGVDSTVFVYNKNKELVKATFYSKGKEDGYCEYCYNGSNRVEMELLYMR